ncbi:MAG: hypothetical protein JXK16_01875 [Thiotrichales bacterium]|nr:hypothetical protein [Thiotrichales bacterium]
MKKSIQLLLAGSFLSAAFSSAYAEELDVSKKDNLEMCVEYFSEKSDSVKQAYFKELDKRGQLSYQDHERLAKGEVGPSSTMCGMYMAKGKPLAEQSRQIRPMTFKAVHVYPDMYYVSQSGMLVEGYERKEGMMPPSLNVEKPAVQAPPVLYGAQKE